MRILSVAVLTDTADSLQPPKAIAAGYYPPKLSPQLFFGRLDAAALGFHTWYNRHDQRHPPQKPYASAADLSRAFAGFYNSHKADVVLVHGASGLYLFTQAQEQGLITTPPNLIDITTCLGGMALEGYAELHHFDEHQLNAWEDPTVTRQRHYYLAYALTHRQWRKAA